MRFTPLFLVALALLALPSVAEAQIRQPNGNIYPVNSANGETQLFTLFSNRSEDIDWVNDASEQPNTFSPLCDFTATLVLKQSSSQLNVGWYNVTGTQPTAGQIYQIFPNALTDASVGMTITGQAIRENPNYTGGLIGFALIRGGGSYYFTERQYNPLCNGGPCDDGGNAYVGTWIMSLSYQSSLVDNAFYVAFEDGNASATGWSNDGDYNDYVFYFTGIACAGAGEVCDVPGAEGICAQGLTQCDGADLECIPVNVSGPEMCDGLDNDCDGTVDNGNLCTDGELCVNGGCVGSCDEFGCGNPDLQCNLQTGECFDPTCEDVTCPSGEVCRQGDCVGPCEGIVCPGEQVCRVGACVDPCANVTCGAMKVCSGGICVATCSCAGCGANLSCEESSGSCVDPDCVDVTCADGLFCSPTTGACVDACTGAVCPDGQMCTLGECVDIPPVEPTDGGTVRDMGGNGDGGGTGDGGGNSDGGGEDAGDGRPRMVSSGCGCRVPAPGQDAPLGLALALLALPFYLRRRRR